MGETEHQRESLWPRRPLCAPCAHALIMVALVATILAGVGSVMLTSAPPVHAASAIQVENSYPGDPTWDDFSASLQPDAISGYGSQISVNHGQSIDFFVTTTASSVTIDIYRMGWYGGTGARHMTTLGTYAGVHQPMPSPDPVTGIIVCNWQKTATLAVPSTWTTGVYLAKLTASSGNKSFIFFVVRDDGGNEDFLFQTSVTTYQAYNTWGGTSLYNNNTNGSIYPYPHATKVSFDRPFNPGDSNGAGHFLWYEYPMLRWVEKQGFDLSYSTDVDTDLNSNPLTNHKGFLVVGHDEYWSMGMRTNVQNAINSGVNVAFFAANVCFWQIRFEPSASGVPDRVEVGYKEFATSTTAPGPDPQLGVNNAIVTTNWRAAPVNQPENGLIGVMFQDENQTDGQPYVVSDASSWVFNNTGFVNGSSVPGIVGYEFDKTFDNGFTPAGLTVLSASPLVGQSNGSSVSNSTLYTASSGARVFASGTIEWSYGLDNFGGRNTANPGIQQTTANILYNFNGGSPPPPPPPLPAGTYLLDGFESGNLTQWLGPQGTGEATAEVATVNSGSYAAELIDPAGAGQYVNLYQDLSGGQEALTYTRFYFQVTNATASPTLATLSDSSGNNRWAAIYDGGDQGLDIYFWNGAGTRFDFYSAANILQTNTWYALEIEFNEASSGQAQMWLNGTSIGTLSGNFSASSTASRMFLWDDASGTTNYFDDVVVSNHYNGLLSTSAPAVTLNPTSLNFGSVTVGATSPTQSVTLTNTGNANLTVSAVGFAGANAGDFSNAGDSCTGATIAPNSTCAVSVAFTPTGGGSRTATLAFTDNASSSPQSVTLSGTGLGAAVSFSPTSLNFGGQLTGTTSAAQSVTLTNSGTGSLNVSSVALGGANAADFAIASDTCTGATVAVNGTCVVSLTFTPSANGSRSASLSFSDSAPGSPQGVGVSGTGTFVAASLSANSVNFGNQSVLATSAAQTLTLTASGTSDLLVSGIAIGGTNAADFAQTNTCGSRVAAGASCTISVTFTPGDAGTRSATLSVNDNAPSSPQQSALSGTGLTADVSVSVTSNKSTVKRGTNVIFTIRVSNGGPGAAPGVTLSDPIPAGTTFVGISTSGTAVTCTMPAAGGTGTISCSVAGGASLAAGGGFTISLTVKVASSAASSVTDTATAAVPATLHYDPTLSNNTASATITAR